MFTDFRESDRFILKTRTVKRLFRLLSLISFFAPLRDLAVADMLCVAKLSRGEDVVSAMIQDFEDSTARTAGITGEGKRPILVVIHDFAPVFLRELNEIVERLSPLIGRQMSVAVVPCWRGTSQGNSSNAYQKLLNSVEERLLHGWTHQSRFPYHPISLLTGQADEMRGLDRQTIIKRIDAGQAAFTELTKQPAFGFVPPAWQLPIRSVEITSLQFVVRYRAIESCRSPDRVLPLATWSWDWGRLGWLSRGGEFLGTIQQLCNPAAIPCIVIHPIDVRRGYLRRAEQLIQAFLERGFIPTTAMQLMSTEV